jgi:molybdenum cofactor cytidylyltransferase
MNKNDKEGGADAASPGRKPSAGRQFGIVILAAGPSTRMGRPKQLLKLGNTPLLARVVEECLASPAWPVGVVLGAHAHPIRPALARQPVLVVENSAWAEGMASSIRAGIGTLRQFSRSIDGALIALCDQPAFDRNSIARLFQALDGSERTIAAAHYSGRCGAPALFLSNHFKTLNLLTGEEGARMLLNGKPEAVAAVPMPELAADLDTPEDWQRHARS